MKDGKPVNWVEVAVRLTQYINETEKDWARESKTPARYFEGPLDVIEFLDNVDRLVKRARLALLDDAND